MEGINLPYSENFGSKEWPYEQYYVGEEDQDHTRSGIGVNHWTGAESQDWYTGNFIRDTMHGEGDYRWRYKDRDGYFVTYEGQFYGNCMHGYGTMSYPDGRVFKGLFHKNMRWGPGVESSADLQENVGLWRGSQLIRLAWQPQTPNITLDMNNTQRERDMVEPHRRFLATRVHIIGEVNSAIEMLKKYGSEPIKATKIWRKLYPIHCNDLTSQACDVDAFDREYYKHTINELEDIGTMPEKIASKTEQNNSKDKFEPTIFYAWNNSDIVVAMMKHCFKHENQRLQTNVNLENILTGPRNLFKHPARHELDCRTLLMASFLGQICNVVQLVNGEEINPDVADQQGNTAVMYATLGDQADIVHFLIGAGANVNSYNDSCITPLGAALTRFVCTSLGIAASGMLQALTTDTPPLSLLPANEKPSEWQITRGLFSERQNNPLQSQVSKTVIGKGSTKKNQDEGIPANRKLTMNVTPDKHSAIQLADENADNISIAREVTRYHNSLTEYLITLTDLVSTPNKVTPVPYIFAVADMSNEVDINLPQKEEKKQSMLEKVDKQAKKNPSKLVKMKSNLKVSQENLCFKDSVRESVSLNSADREKKDMLNRIMTTILQLLKDGADSRLVRCPGPALWLATTAGSPDLVRELVKHGADVNETFPEALNYTVLDIAVSQPLTRENLELVKAILECGALTHHRLKYGDTSNTEMIDGPTLLHAILAKKPESNEEEEIRQQLLELLLEYKCNALTQFKGTSAIDWALTTKNLGLLNTIIKCPKTDLNAKINNQNQTALVKMFYVPFQKTFTLSESLETLTNLMVYGADPLLQCQDVNDTYSNIFVFARKSIMDMTGGIGIVDTPAEKIVPVVEDKGAKKGNQKTVKDTKNVNKSQPFNLAAVEDYKQRIDLVTECARMLYVRWIQGKLIRELIEVIEKFKHRHWSMILPEYKNKKACGLWVSYTRSLEIWNIFQARKMKRVVDGRIVKHLLCIVHFNQDRAVTSFMRPISVTEKDRIEAEVFRYLREDNTITAGDRLLQLVPWPYATPELVKDAVKFNVCFECVLPFREEKIVCKFCKQVSFCSLKCMKANISRSGCHPCSSKLQSKYFDSDTNILTSSIM